MKILRTVLLAFMLIQLATGCQLFNKCVSIDLIKLTEESKKWAPYELNSKLIFESDTSQDTIIVSHYQEEIESFFRGDECGYGKMEVVEAKLISKLFVDTISFSIVYNDRVLLDNENFYIDFRDSGKFLRTADNSKSYNPTLTIAQKIYTEAIVSKCPTCDKLNEIVFAKNLGLVAYKIDNTYWTRKQ